MIHPPEGPSRNGLRTLVFILALLAPPAAAWADTVRMENGDRLTGKVLEVSDGKLTLGTDYAGTLKIAWAKVDGVETEHPVRIRLEDDQVLVGRLVAADKGVLKLQEDGQPAPREIRKPELDRLNEPGTIWHGSFTLSGKLEEGNTNSTSAVAGAEILRETENTRLLIRGNYGNETKEDVKTEDNYYGLAKFDLHLSKESYAYASDEVRRDKFEDLQFRNVASLGAGYIVSKSDTFSLWAEAGPAYITENLDDGTSEQWFGGRAAGHARIRLPFGLEVRDDFTVYPNFETWDDWQFHNEAALATQIGQGWHLSFSVIMDWDNEPEAGREQGDNKYIFGLGYRF